VALEYYESFTGDLNSGNVIQYFYADWCGPCKMMQPFLGEIAESTGANLIAERNLRSVPTMIFMKDGQEIDRKSGFIPQPILIDLIKSM